MRLRVLIGAGRARQLAGAVIDVAMALRRAVDAIGPIEPGVEPLRRVGRAHLAGEHEAGSRRRRRAASVLGVEIAALPAPIGPGAGQPVEHLAGVGLAAEPGARPGSAASANSSACRRHSQDGTPASGTGISVAGTPALRKYFCARMSAGDLAPFRRHLDAVGVEHDRAVGVANLARRGAERNLLVGISAGCGKATRDLHSFPRNLISASTGGQPYI